MSEPNRTALPSALTSMSIDACDFLLCTVQLDTVEELLSEAIAANRKSMDVPALKRYRALLNAARAFRAGYEVQS